MVTVGLNAAVAFESAYINDVERYMDDAHRAEQEEIFHSGCNHVDSGRNHVEEDNVMLINDWHRPPGGGGFGRATASTRSMDTTATTRAPSCS